MANYDCCHCAKNDICKWIEDYNRVGRIIGELPADDIAINNTPFMITFYCTEFENADLEETKNKIETQGYECPNCGEHAFAITQDKHSESYIGKCAHCDFETIVYFQNGIPSLYNASFLNGGVKVYGHVKVPASWLKRLKINKETKNE